MQIAFGEPGRIMLGGEFESAKVIYAATPDFIPAPVGFGRFRAPNPAAYFYLSEYVDVDVPVVPDPDEFSGRLAHMHMASRSPNGKFGFHVPTCDGDRTQVVGWQDTWAAFYRAMFLGVCALDMKRNGPWPEYERAIEQIANKVIPRLLGNLRDGDGRPIKPRIIHGDLWDGNVGQRKRDGASILFDAGSFYGHTRWSWAPGGASTRTCFGARSTPRRTCGTIPRRCRPTSLTIGTGCTA